MSSQKQPLRRVLFIDRDGTILVEPADEQIDSFEKFQFVPGVIRNLNFIRTHLDFEFVLVSNQDGLGTDSYPEADFLPTHNLMLDILKGEGVEFDAQHIDRSFPADNLPTRKPGTAMLTQYMQGDYDLAGSYVIGDRATDRKLAENLGCKYLILGDNVQSWDEIHSLGSSYHKGDGHRCVDEPRRHGAVRCVNRTRILRPYARTDCQTWQYRPQDTCEG